MKYRYLYQTKENRTVDGWIEAANRADAYAALRKQGIRPLRVIGDDPVPRRAWKWWAMILALASALAVSVVALRMGRRAAVEIGERKQILGDQTLIEMNVRMGWARCFSSEGERILAAYAQPGWNVDRSKLAGGDALVESLKVESKVKRDDPIEFRQVKEIVARMKVELRTYLSQGGTPEGYLERLHERQLAEVGAYEQASRKFAEASSRMCDEAQYLIWLKINAGLREMGVRTLPMPEKFAK